MDELVQEHEINCSACTQPILSDIRFCPHCGARQKGVDLNHHRKKFDRYLSIPAIFFGLNLLGLVVTYFVAQSGDVSDMIYLYNDIYFILITLIFSLILRRDLARLFTVPHLYIVPLLILIIPISYLVSISTDAINESLDGFQSVLLFFEGSPYQYIISGIMIVFVPAVFEELAFRGIIQSSLNKIMGENASLLVTAFTFFIIHLAMFSIYWLLPFALLLGWLRKRYNTLIYGMILHAIHNASVFLLENWDGIFSEPGFAF